MTTCTDLTTVAKALHAEQCRRVGIWDAAKIALYWEGCDQRRYERLVDDAANGRGTALWVKEIVSRAHGEDVDK
jgi:hypothetical protein